ncbi:MAG: DNRLRE domain-containing protein, partial [Bacteroidota bacterium]
MKILHYTGVAVLWCMASWSLYAQEISSLQLTASKDNTLFEEDTPTSNGQGTDIFAAYTNQRKIRRGLLQFDLSDVPANALIQSVRLAMSVTRTRGQAEDLQLHRMLQDWGEGTSSSSEQSNGGGRGAAATAGDATWLHRYYPDQFWETPGGDFEAEASATATNVSSIGEVVWQSEQLLQDVQNWVSNPEQNFGWAILSDETIQRSAKRFASREGRADLAPILQITWTLPVIEEEIDLNLSLAVSDENFPKFKPNTTTLTLQNEGNITATGIDVELPLPSGIVVLVGGTIP